MEKINTFSKLASIDVSELAEPSADGLRYLPWAVAWRLTKENFPNASYKVHYAQAPNEVPYFTDGKYAWVKVSVDIDGVELSETRPIMDRDDEMKAMPLESIDSCIVNYSIKRCLVKCLALHGLGLSLYFGEKAFTEPRTTQEKAAGKVAILEKYCRENGMDIARLCKEYAIKDLSEFPDGKVDEAVERLQKYGAKKKQSSDAKAEDKMPTEKAEVRAESLFDIPDEEDAVNIDDILKYCADEDKKQDAGETVINFKCAVPAEMKSLEGHTLNEIARKQKEWITTLKKRNIQKYLTQEVIEALKEFDAA